MISKVVTACFEDQSSIAAIQRWARNAELFADPSAAIKGLAAPFVAGKLQEIAVAPLFVNIRFADGVPVALNGVEMTLTELLDGLETITGEPALAVLQRAGFVQTGPAEPQPA
jgi:argininosuccinate synthase